MEGPLVSDTAELLDAPSASEGSPVGTVEGSKSRGRSGTGLASLLMPELQRIAQEMGITGTGRMRKSQLVEAIEARQGSAAPRGTAKKDSDQRGTSAGAGATRPLKQDAMELDTSSHTGIGASAELGIGDGGRGGLGAATVTASAVQHSTAPAVADQVSTGQTVTGQAVTGQAGAEQAGAGQQAGAGDGPAGEYAADAQRPDRRRRSRTREDQPQRSREAREPGIREAGTREAGTREQSAREPGIREQSTREQGGREQNVREQSGREPSVQGRRHHPAT